MQTTADDGFGIALAFSLGTVIGIALGAAALPPGFALELGESTLDPIGTALLLGAFALICIPLGMVLLYVVFGSFDR
ncbi:hypothetical protein [Natronomonas sp. EA1]|uniref:hypothetical protein n=1 Tax=Natronomonas sp. EA1 TaxID=3421655 RepID=UPI003EBE2724